jgi:hypothetical protein
MEYKFENLITENYGIPEMTISNLNMVDNYKKTIELKKEELFYVEYNFYNTKFSHINPIITFYISKSEFSKKSKHNINTSNNNKKEKIYIRIKISNFNTNYLHIKNTDNLDEMCIDSGLYDVIVWIETFILEIKKLYEANMKCQKFFDDFDFTKNVYKKNLRRRKLNNIIEKIN